MQNIEEILKFIQTSRLNVSQTEREAGIKAGRMDKWLKGFGKPKAEDSGKLQTWYKLNYNGALEEIRKDAPVSDFKPISGHDVSIKIIADLSASSKEYSLADHKRAASELLREQNNSRILDYITKQNEAILSRVGQFENEQQEIPQVFQSRLTSILEFLSEVAAGKRYRSANEASAVLSKLVYDGPGNKKGKDIHRDSGK